MPFWRKDTEEEKQAKARQEACIKALEGGDLPPIAIERIMREREMGKNYFSSDLSTREFLLTKEAGFQPISQVMGTAFFKVGFWGGFNRYQTITDELPKVTEALANARRTAVERLKKEAKLLGASGVIGVRLRMTRHEWASNITEFTAFGTAIRIADWPAGEEPFTSALNGQEFWQLYNAGYLPRAIVMGACAYYMHMNADVRQVCYGWFSPNQEIQSYTHGHQEASKRARNRMLQEVELLQADGVVGVTVDPGTEHIRWETTADRECTDILLNYTIVGTDVSRHPEKKQKHDAPLMCLDLRKGSFARLNPSAGYDWNSDLDDTLIDETD